MNAKHVQYVCAVATPLAVIIAIAIFMVGCSSLESTSGDFSRERIPSSAGQIAAGEVETQEGIRFHS